MTDKPTTPRQSADLYRKAAERISAGKNWYSCVALEGVAGRAARIAYVETFKPRNVWHEPQDKQRNIRVLMLCFMAAMVEAGDA